MFTFDIDEDILRTIRRCERGDLLKKLLGISLLPQYHSNHLRVLTLIQLALVHSKGHHKATKSDLISMLNGLLEHESGKNEDPAEDVFVTAVSTQQGQYRIFNGLYLAADIGLQRLLDAVLTRELNDAPQLRSEIDALLSMSEEIALRCDLSVNTYEPSEHWRNHWAFNLSRLSEIGSSAYFTADDLQRIGVSINILEPFLLGSLEGLLEDPFGRTALSRRPLIVDKKGGVFVPIPSLVSPALRLHIAHGIAEHKVPQEAIAGFHALPLGRWLTVDLPLRKNQVLTAPEAFLPKEQLDLPGVTQAVVRFDEDKLAHLFIIDADWSNPPQRDIHEPSDVTKEFENELAEYLQEAFEAIRQSQGINRGLTIVVYDSPGWQVNMALPEDMNSDWFCVGVQTRSLAPLFWDRSFSLLELWKMLREDREIRDTGIQLFLWPDILVYWSVWLKLGGTFWPKGLDIRTFGAFAPGTDMVAELMADLRSRSYQHAVPSVSGEWCRVERWVDEHAPEGEYSKPIFADSLSVAVGGLRGVVETEFGLWWVAIGRPPFSVEERVFFFLLWQGTLEWLHLIAQSSHGRLQANASPLQVTLIPIPKTITDGPSDIELQVSDSGSEIMLLLPALFLESLAMPTNAGEKRLVEAILDGLLRLEIFKDGLPKVDCKQWAEEICRNPAVKMLHVTEFADAGLVLDQTAVKAPLRWLQRNDFSRTTRHVRDALSEKQVLGVKIDTTRVEGKADVQKILHETVRMQGDKSQALAAKLDRTQTLILIFRLIEAVHRDRVEWERAANARTLLYQSDNDRWAELWMGQRDQAFHAYRVAAEIVLCAAPLVGGRKSGISDVDQIAAEVQEMINLGRFSDGIQLKIIEPILSFAPDGSIDLNTADVKVDMGEYTAASLSEVVASDIEAYPKLFDKPRDAEASELESDDTGILAAFEAEYGLSLVEAVRCVRALQDLCVNEGSDVVALRQHSVEQRVASGDPAVSVETLRSFLVTFGLPTRDKWSDPPAEYGFDDVMPWFYERKLSLMVRPVAIVSAEKDPLLIFGVRQLDMSVHYAAALLENGIWAKKKLRSPEAQSYVEQEIQRRGRLFEEEVAQTFSGAGWTVLAGRSMQSLGASLEFGDLDVLGISPDGESWFVVECKWFGAVRTPREIANWLQDFRGISGDKLDRHLRRFKWIQDNVSRLAKIIHVETPQQIQPVIVTKAPVPLAFMEDLPPEAKTWTIRELAHHIGYHSVSI
jgi:hypothetical protein